MEYSVEQVIEKALELSKSYNFRQVANTREYELIITEYGKNITATKEKVDQLLENVKKYYKENKAASFSIYFVLFTMCRRQNFGELLNLVYEFQDAFQEYEIMQHIYLMAVLEKISNASSLYNAIKKSGKMVEMKNYYCDFSKHCGVLNVYTSLVCKYFEYQLDERTEQDNIELLNKAKTCIINAIELEKKREGAYNKVYDKFYLNYGRILVLLGQYNKGEDEIQKAISLLKESTDRSAKVNEYNQYLLKASIIRSYDLNEEKVKDLDKIKVSNYKSIALMTTLLGFLLGTINIFVNVKDTFTLSMLMLSYAGLLLVLLGTILLGFTLTLKERKVRLYVYDSVLIIIGIAIFVLAMIIINKG